MFTGIIKYLGKVERIIEQPFGKTITLSCPDLVRDLNIDDSVAVNGVCLTATTISEDKTHFTADIVHTSLEKTTLKNFSPGQSVHLELAAQISDRLGGHLVQGHVQGIGLIKSIYDKGGNFDVEIALPEHLMNYQVDEGPIVIDGISMTVAKCHPQHSSVTITVIPHTWDRTLLSHYQVGSLVNIEADLIAQYVYKFIEKLKVKNER
ncbi:MAG: riboflavin synthase [Bacteriovoracaceae bacterium]|nr:riboflavin synthase [Bacteriovoracaceae bacterium]